MSNMTQTDRNQLTRYDLRETRPPMTRLNERGTRLLAGLTIVFCGVLASLSYAAVAVFDGWHHAIILADITVIVLALAAWTASMRPPAEIEAESSFIPQGLRPTPKD